MLCNEKIATAAAAAAAVRLSIGNTSSRSPSDHVLVKVIQIYVLIYMRVHHYM
jgi:hypothetical protein